MWEHTQILNSLQHIFVQVGERLSCVRIANIPIVLPLVNAGFVCRRLMDQVLVTGRGVGKIWDENPEVARVMDRIVLHVFLMSRDALKVNDLIVAYEQRRIR